MLKDKSAESVTRAMLNIMKSTPRKPKNIQSDDGREFFNQNFRALMKGFDINHYSTYSVKKASIAERFIRTIKTWLWQRFMYNGSYKWITQE